MTAIRSLPLAYDPEANGARCSECPCKGQRVVPPSYAMNPTQPQAILIGMEPGFEEERALVPFVGRSGKRLDAALVVHRLQRRNMHVSNASLCRPKRDEDRKKAFECCKPRLDNELKPFHPSIPIVTMGAPAFQSVYGKKLPISLARGFLWQVNGHDLLPTLHPAFVLRDPTQAPLLARDFRRFAERLQNGKLELPEAASYTIPRTAIALKKWLNTKAKGKPLIVDIETTEEPATKCEMICIGLGTLDLHCAVVPWGEWARPVLAKGFKDKTIITHNGFSFDAIVMERYGIPVPDEKLEDTLIAHHAFAAHMKQSLDFVASFYLDAAIPWKIIYGKRATSVGEKGAPKLSKLTQDELFQYNSYDLCYSAIVWEKMQPDLAKAKKVYEFDKNTAAFCRHMAVVGVKVDIKRKEELSKAIAAKEARLFEAMKKACGHDFTPTKTVDIRKILFQEFHAPVLERTPKKLLPATSKGVLQAFAVAKGKEYGSFCRDLLTWRACAKMRVTYLDNLPVDEDGRVHPGWRSFGTVGSRLSCKKPNLQNLKRFDGYSANPEPETQIRSIYVPEKGRVLVSFDMCQIEMRVAAYVSKDPNFIASCESKDLHTANARIVFGDIPELNDPKGAGKKFRDISKETGFAAIYCAQANTMYENLLAKGHNVKMKAVLAMYDALHKGFNVYFKFADENFEHVKREGWLLIGYLSGRKRWFNRNDVRISDTGNAPIQSTAGEIINERLPLILKRIPDRSRRLVAQVHDQGIFEPLEKDATLVENIIKEEMARPVKLLNGIEFVAPIDLKTGYRWSEL